MLPIVQKLPIDERQSFVARTYRTPHFEVGWHQHIEYELILFTEGNGMSFVGNHIGEFETGDVYFLGSNLPHTFQKSRQELVTSAIVVQFVDSIWGEQFRSLPEINPLNNLFNLSARGLKAHPDTAKKLIPLITELELAQGFRRMNLLLESLEILAALNACVPLCHSPANVNNNKHKAIIDKVFQHTISNFRERISLNEVAEMACMSIPVFCAYFKKSTQKTYIDFLNEVRVGFAASQLLETDKTVSEVAFESGFQTVANFHKQFQRIRKYSPLQYRKRYRMRLFYT